MIMLAQPFVLFFSTSPPEAPHGYMEACRVLAHCLKDKHKDQHQNENMSRFLQKASEEATEALNNHDKVKGLYKKVLMKLGLPIVPGLVLLKMTKVKARAIIQDLEAKEAF